MRAFCIPALLLALSSPVLVAQVSASSFSGSDPASAGSIFKVLATPSPNQPPPANNYLESISASSPTDIWAVGAGVIHFDGQQWTGFSVPDMSGTGSSLLNGVADLSPDNVWAVGFINFQIIGAYPAGIVEHFDGASWSVFPSPQFPPPDQAYLRAITAISPTDIWAGGNLFEDPYFLSLLEHFDGTSWKQMETPVFFCGILGMSADASNDVWAVGATLGGGTCALHYDGTRWESLPTPNPGFGYNYLQGVTVLAPNNVWAAGWFTRNSNSDRPTRTLIEHWDGTSWQIVPSPDVVGKGEISSRLNGIVAVSANDLWAFGESSIISSSHAPTLVLHWNGTSWAIVPSPAVRLGSLLDDYLWGGTVIPNNGLFIVGSDNVEDTLVLKTQSD